MRRSASIATWRRAGQTKWLRNAFHNRRRTTRFLDSSPHSTSIAIGVSYSTNTVSSYAKGTLELEKPTIYALSTAPGRAGIAIIRISGPACRSIYHGLCPNRKIPEDRRAVVRSLYDPTKPPSTDTLLDRDALILRFDNPATVTGEDVLELHVHGGPATVKAVLAAIPLCEAAGHIRYAEAGEFTRRAFENHRLDLAQVEALSIALSADTEMQRRAAMNGTSGALGRKYELWRQQLLEARGELEAIIDFSEDQDFDVSDSNLLNNIEQVINPMVESIQRHEDGGRRAELLRKGIRISLLGPPNVGKSSLLNRIVGREASIVSTEAGTTRDIVEVSVDIEGYLCTFADTAGLRTQPSFKSSTFPSTLPVQSSIGPIEQEGISRAKQKAAESDLVIAFASVESRSTDDNLSGFVIQYDVEVLRIASQAPKSIIVVNKKDIVPREQFVKLLSRFKASLKAHGVQYDSGSIVGISCNPEILKSLKTPGEDSGNIHGLTTALAEQFEDMTYVDERGHLGVTERQRQLLKACREHCLEYLKEAQKTGDASTEFDVVVSAEHLRAAATCLSRITGRGEAGDVEEVLGVVFEKFCVGK